MSSAGGGFLYLCLVANSAVDCVKIFKDDSEAMAASRRSSVQVSKAASPSSASRPMEHLHLVAPR